MKSIMLPPIAYIDEHLHGLSKLLTFEPPENTFLLSLGAGILFSLNRLKVLPSIGPSFHEHLLSQFTELLELTPKKPLENSIKSISELIRTIFSLQIHEGYIHLISYLSSENLSSLHESFEALYNHQTQNPNLNSDLNLEEITDFITSLKITLKIIDKEEILIEGSTKPSPLIILEKTGPYFYLGFTEEMEQADIEQSAIMQRHPYTHIFGSKGLCSNECPDCNVNCELPANHTSPHFSSKHSHSSTLTPFFPSIEEEDTIITKRENYIPYSNSCERSCLEKGRGHLHLKLCLSGENCLVNKYPGHAIHVNPLEETEGEFFDAADCSTYWKSLNWEAPLERYTQIQENFMKCNFLCIHSHHENEKEPIWCEAPVLHSIGHKYYEHKFFCDHVSFRDYDIVFIIDSTGSMGSSFPKVKESIIEIIGNWSEVATTKFGVVAYTDHGPDNAHYPPNNPIGVYPASKNMEEGEVADAITFIEGLNANGGGGMQGEAMIDGIHGANELKFRTGSKIVYILLADDTPHGKEFHERTTHPNGCPCKLKWREILEVMKGRGVEFIFCVLADMLNRTFELFNEVYGGEIKQVNEVTGLETFTEDVCGEVSEIIEKNLELIKY